MKLRTLLATTALSVGTFAMAQNQSWTATDINGNTHSIADYIAQGKTVLVDISAHWCGPCWAWHNSGIMERLYHEFGPEGTDDLMIFFVDGDPASSMALLQGASGSQGDWTEGGATPYPIIGPNGQGNTLANLYGISAYPTLFMHCPGSNAGVEIQRTSSWETFFASWRNSCMAPFTNGVNDATLLLNEDVQLCPGESPYAYLYNMGTAALTSATLDLKQNGTTLQTVNWTGNLARWGTAKVNFDEVEVTSPQDFSAEVSMPNNVVDEHTEGFEEAYTYEPAPDADLATVSLEVRTDNYGSETTWKLYNSANQVVQQDPAGNYANNTTYTYWWNLNPSECYRLEVLDAYGDGMCCSYGNGYFKLRSNGVIVAQGGQFGDVDKEKFVAGLAVGIEENSLEAGLNLFPNPTTGAVKVEFNLASASNVRIAVLNVLGEQVLATNKAMGAGLQQTDLSLNELPNGSYFVHILADGLTAVRKVTLNR